MRAALAAHVAQQRARAAALAAEAVAAAGGQGGAPAPHHASGAMASFNRIILKFPRLNRAFADVDLIFRRFDADLSGTIDAGELALCLAALGAPRASLLPEGAGAGAEAEVDWGAPSLLRELFRYAHVDSAGAAGAAALRSLTFKEFLLCLAVASVIELFPGGGSFSRSGGAGGAAGGGAGGAGGEEPAASHKDKLAAALAAAAAADAAAFAGASAGASAGAGGAAAMPVEGSAAAGSAGAAAASAGAGDDAAIAERQRQLVSAMHIVLDAYVLFDKDGNGSIDREEVLAMIDDETMHESDDKAAAGRRKGAAQARGPKSPSANALLSRQRWEELDWDDDGSITFKEFLFAMFKWCGLEDEDEEE